MHDKPNVFGSLSCGCSGASNVINVMLQLAWHHLFFFNTCTTAAAPRGVHPVLDNPKHTFLMDAARFPSHVHEGNTGLSSFSFLHLFSKRPEWEAPIFMFFSVILIVRLRCIAVGKRRHEDRHQFCCDESYFSFWWNKCKHLPVVKYFKIKMTSPFIPIHKLIIDSLTNPDKSYSTIPICTMYVRVQTTKLLIRLRWKQILRTFSYAALFSLNVLAWCGAPSCTSLQEPWQ